MLIIWHWCLHNYAAIPSVFFRKFAKGGQNGNFGFMGELGV